MPTTTRLVRRLTLAGRTLRALRLRGGWRARAHRRGARPVAAARGRTPGARAATRAKRIVTVRRLGRLTVTGGVLVVATLWLPAAPAYAAPPTSMTISGTGLADELTVRADKRPEMCAALWGQVNWLANRPGQTTAPKAARQGPKYTVVVFVKDKPTQTYDLYPLAQGGPRVYRPGKQPDLRRTTSAWFFGRLNMSETLRAAGVPLPPRPDALGGGYGGGVGEDSSFKPMEDMRTMVGQWRQVFLLNAAVIVAIALGLAGFALLVRRKV